MEKREGTAAPYVTRCCCVTEAKGRHDGGYRDGEYDHPRLGEGVWLDLVWLGRWLANNWKLTAHLFLHNKPFTWEVQSFSDSNELPFILRFEQQKTAPFIHSSSGPQTPPWLLFS